MPILKKTKFGKCVRKASVEEIVVAAQSYCERGMDLHVVDDNTERNFMHMIIGHAHKFDNRRGVSVIYLFAVHVSWRFIPFLFYWIRLSIPDKPILL